MAPRPSIAERYRRAQQSGEPLVGGHRGNPAEFPENTLASFRSAIELGVDVIECDVHMSADGELVVIHDHTLDRTTNGTGMVRDHTYAELRELDAGGGERVPLLREFLELGGETNVGLAIELKQIPIPYPGIESRVVELVRAVKVLDLAAVISFQHRSVRELVEEMHAAGKAVGVWTVDDAAGVMWCRICKPDSVFTNRPREIGALLKS